jgi:hypothetical protein
MKRLKIIGIIIGSLLIVLTIIWLILDYRTSRMLNAELKAIRDAGEPLTFAELAPPPVPDEENAALLYEKALKLVTNDIIIPIVELTSHDKPETPELIQSACKILDENKEAINLVYQGSLRPKCRYTVDYSSALPIKFPDLMKTRNCVNLLAGEAIIKLKDNKIEEALKSCLTGLKFANSLNQPPTLILHMMHIACLDIILKPLKKVLEQENPDPVLIKSLLNELDIQGLRNDLTKSYLAEQCMEIEVFNNPLIFWNDCGRPYLYRLYFSFIYAPIRKIDHTYYLRLMTKVINTTKLPYYQSSKESDKLDKEISNIPSYYLITHWMLGTTSTSHIAHSIIESKIYNARFALALKIYKSKHGEYPETLKALTPDILDSIPLDPFSGKDFIYHKKNDGFIVYSVGWNLKDDGGLVTRRKDEGDIVWECEK